MELSFLGLGYNGCKDAIDVFNMIENDRFSEKNSFKYEALFSGSKPRLTLIDIGHKLSPQAVFNDETLQDNIYTESNIVDEQIIPDTLNPEKSFLSFSIRFQQPDIIDIPSFYSSYQGTGFDYLSSISEGESIARAFREQMDDSLRKQWEAADHPQALFCFTSADSGWSAFLPDIAELATDYIPKRPVVVNSTYNQVSSNLSTLLDRVSTLENLHHIFSRNEQSSVNFLTKLNFFANSSSFATKNLIESLEIAPSIRYLNSSIAPDLIIPQVTRPFAMNHFVSCQNEEVLSYYRRFGPKFLEISDKFTYRVSEPLFLSDKTPIFESDTYSSWLNFDGSFDRDVRTILRRQKILCRGQEWESIKELVDELDRI